MKNTLVKIAALIMSFTLISCSTNTQKQNMTTGVVTGAVVGGLAGSLIGQGAGKAVAIGAGAILGGFVGGEIGKSMDSSDKVNTYQALEHNHTNKASHWRNMKTGARYTVIPTSGRFTVNGNPNCRKFRTTAYINGEKQQVYGVACRQSNGTWQTVDTHQ